MVAAFPELSDPMLNETYPMWSKVIGNDEWLAMLKADAKLAQPRARIQGRERCLQSAERLYAGGLRASREKLCEASGATKAAAQGFSEA
jgi:hypothetical protein